MIDQQRIGKYLLVEKIGEGAMGEVWKAHDPILNRDVAVKMMSALLTADDELVQRFRREAQSAARLNHPNIVTIFDFGDEDGKFYLAMELLLGDDLKELIARNALHDLWDKIEVMEQVCDGLAFAHLQGVVHRDLKPANIRVLPNGRVKIMDFGLARLGSSEMTRTGMVMGTPNYMSPEQVRGQKADVRSDIFSLGAVFYELLTSQKAFQASSMHSILYKVLEEQPEPVHRFVPGLPVPFVELVEKALDKDPARRFPDATSMRVAVREVREALASEGSAYDGMASGEATMIATAEATLLESARTAPRLASPVAGNTALDPLRVPVPSRPAAGARHPTLSGRAATQGGRPVRGPAPRGPRWPIYTGVGMAVALALAAAVFFALRSPAPPPPTPAPDLASQKAVALTEQIVAEQLELARVNLENKDYKAAVEEADRALALDATSREAVEVKDRATRALADLNLAAADARTAFAAGNTEQASRALSRVLAIDPRHPVAGELSASLNQHFRGQAEEARRYMAQSREAAVSLRASALPGFGDAERLVREAESLFKGEQFTVATQRYMQSRDGYERARRAAEAANEKAAQRAVATHAPRASPAVAVNTPPTTLPPAATAPPATQAPVFIQPPPVTQAPAATQEPAVRDVIARYGRAIESRDLALFRSVKPNLSGDEEQRLADAFKAIKSQRVGISIESVQVDGSVAVVRVSRQDTINGKQVQRVQQTFRLAQAGGAWIIQSIGQ